MQSQVRLLAGELAARGADVTIAVGGGELSSVSDCDVVALPPFGGLSTLLFLRALRRLIRARRPQIVHGHGLRLAPVLALASAPRSLVTCHGLDPLRTANTARIVKLSRVRVLTCGKGPQVQLAAYGLASTVVNNVVVVKNSHPSSEEMRTRFELTEGVPILLLPARFSEQKNHQLFLAALALVRQELGAASPEVVCCGDGPLFDAVRQRAEQPRDRPLLRCFDYEPDAASWFGATDFFVLPSRWEGQPGVVLEALAQGLAVLSSTSVGVEDLIVEGRNGRRVTNADEMAKVIVQWCRDPSLRPIDETLNAALLQEHSLDAVVTAHEEIYAR